MISGLYKVRSFHTVVSFGPTYFCIVFIYPYARNAYFKKQGRQSHLKMQYWTKLSAITRVILGTVSNIGCKNANAVDRKFEG